MTETLRSFVERETQASVPAAIVEAARLVATRLGGVAVLFYGSVLRTGDLEGVLDFYVLTDGNRQRGLRALGMRWLWPDVSFEEAEVGGRTLRAKVATMPLATFGRAAGGRTLDTTVWARFTQPCALIWAADERVHRQVVDALAAAAVTAGSYAAMMGARTDDADGYWAQLFRQTYTAELRVEAPGRERQLLGYAPQHYDRLLPLAWTAAGIGYGRAAAALTPSLTPRACGRLFEAWAVRQRLGKLLNVARLVKASFTFDGAARYGLWKLERHTGVHVALTPWRERHPVLAAPRVLWTVWRSTRPA